jgi:hypothetical protein
LRVLESSPAFIFSGDLQQRLHRSCVSSMAAEGLSGDGIWKGHRERQDEDGRPRRARRAACGRKLEASAQRRSEASGQRR